MPHCRTDGQNLTCGRGLRAPLPGGCLAYRPATGRRVPAARLPGGGLPQGAKMRLKINFIYIQVPTARQEGVRGSAAPQPGGRGINLSIMKPKIYFYKKRF